MNVNSINSKSFESEFGVYLKRATGMFDFLKRKGKTFHDWQDQDGVEPFVENDDILFEKREITMQCYLVANGEDDFRIKVNSLKSELLQEGLHELVLQYSDRIYDVYFDAGTKFKLKTSWNTGKLIAEFDLKFIEPNPTNKKYLP